MKKILVVILTLLFSVALLGLANPVDAADDNIVSGGDFEGFIADGETELAFGDPAFSSGVQKGWGSGSWDSHCIAVKDPLNSENTVLKFSNTVAGKAWCSFFKFCTIEAGACIENAIIDRNNHISAGTVIKGTEADPLVIPKVNY